MDTMQWKIGMVGFGYKSLVGSFYPAGMSQKGFLAHYSQQFNSVEIDSTFYGIPRAEQMTKWYQTVPPQFTFCVKTPRQITHEMRLRGAEEEMGRFLEVVSGLREKLGAVLIQVGPDFTFEELPSLAAFIGQLPRDFRYAIEFRHSSWVREETTALLQKHHICMVAADYIHLPKVVTRTTDFLYLRFIGPHGRFKIKDKEQLDQSEALHNWYEQIKPHLSTLSTVYGFFNSDYSGSAFITADRFRRLVGLPVQEIRPLQQPRLL